MPAIEPMNSTGGEQWAFDGVSNDDNEAFIFGFYRDPNYSFFGSGNLRAYAEFALKDGTRYAIVYYAEEATLQSCPGIGTRGVWKGDDFLYEFFVSEDMSHTSILMDTPEAKTKIEMVSVAPPRSANNAIWPASDSSALTVPHFYWVEPVPVADLSIEGVIEGQNNEWTGMGGHERLWGAFNWYTCLASLVAVKLHAGSYALSFLEMGSAIEEGLRVPSILLVENGKKIFSTRNMVPSSTEDFMTIRKAYGGGGATTKDLLDKVTGIEVLLHSPGQNKQWRFNVLNSKVLFEYVLGEGVGGTAYSGTTKGGVVGEEKDYNGPAFTEIMKMPKRSWLLSKNFLQ